MASASLSLSGCSRYPLGPTHIMTWIPAISHFSSVYASKMCQSCAARRQDTHAVTALSLEAYIELLPLCFHAHGLCRFQSLV